MKTSGEKLRDLRIAYDLSQREFGEKVGIKRGSFNAYENNVHPLPTSVKRKIMQATGIGLEYFDTDMSLDEAFAKYNIDPNNPNNEIKDLEMANCAIYRSLSHFVKGKCVEKSFGLHSLFLRYVFRNTLSNFDVHFVEINNSKFQSYAENGEFLLVSKNERVSYDDLIIIDYDGDIRIAKYSKLHDKIILDFNQIEKRTFYIDEFEREVKVLGVIVAKMSIETYRDSYL